VQEYLLDEVIHDTVAGLHASFLKSPVAIAQDAAHGIAFHRGLGEASYPYGLGSPASPVAAEVEAYAAASYIKPNIALVGSGIDSADFAKWVPEFFSELPTAKPQGLPATPSPSTKYFGGESRISSSKGSAMVLAFPGTSLASGSAYKPEIDALAALLGGQSTIKWSAGSSVLGKIAASHPGVKIATESIKYTDTGLLSISISGPAKSVGAAAKDVAGALKSLSPAAEDLKKAVAQAKFKAYDATTGEAPAYDEIGLALISSGKVASAEEALKGISSLSESAVSTVSNVPERME